MSRVGDKIRVGRVTPIQQFLFLALGVRHACKAPRAVWAQCAECSGHFQYTTRITKGPIREQEIELECMSLRLLMHIPKKNGSFTIFSPIVFTKTKKIIKFKLIILQLEMHSVLSKLQSTNPRQIGFFTHGKELQSNSIFIK